MVPLLTGYSSGLKLSNKDRLETSPSWSVSAHAEAVLFELALHETRFGLEKNTSSASSLDQGVGEEEHQGDHQALEWMCFDEVKAIIDLVFS